MMTISTSNKTCAAVYLGFIPYEGALKLQQRLMTARAEGNIPDILLLLQHPPVLTVGRFRGDEDIIVSPETLIQEGIDVFHTNRGGGITYHGPGQLVGYPIMSLKENCLSVREYIWKLEEVIIRLLFTLGIEGHRVARYPGSVWLDEKKVCSIGVRVGRYVTMHGFALNVSNALQYFKYIKPCGLKSEVMTSLQEFLRHPVKVETIIENLLDSFSEVFRLDCELGDYRWMATPDALNG